MEDSRIIELYWRRDEKAIAETSQKFGSFCIRVAMNILSVREDAEECVNDTYHRAWNAIPPERPAAFRAWLGRIVRNLSLNRYQKNHASKRFSGMDAMLSELEDCIPSPQNVETIIETNELSELISDWLMSLPKEDRVLFVKRYRSGEALKTLAAEHGISQNKLAQRMYRMRISLKVSLEREGVYL